MKLYYTTTYEPDTEQSNPIKSLGMFKSSSLLPNATLNNMFGELSTYTLSKMKDEYIALMLVNDTGGAVTGVNIYFDHPEDSYSVMKVDAILPATDGDGNYYIESIPDRYSRPLYSSPVEADIDSKLAIGDMADGAYVGIWVKRELLSDFISSDTANIYEIDTASTNQRRYVGIEKSTEDDISMVIEWD